MIADIRFLSPAGLPKPTGHIHVVATRSTSVYISGQVAFDSAGNLVGEVEAIALIP